MYKHIKTGRHDIAHVDAETGEVLSFTCDCNEICVKRILKEKEYKIMTKEFNKNKKFKKLFNGEISKLLDKLSLKEFAVAMALKEYIEHKTCKLVIKDRNMNLKDISEVTDTNYTSISKIVKKLKAKNVIAEIEVKSVDTNKLVSVFLFNPYICCNGKEVEEKSVAVFLEKEEFENDKQTSEQEKEI